MKALLLILYSLVLLTLGTCCLFLPRSVQALASKMIETGPTARIHFLKAFVQSNIYIVNVRFIGILAYAGFALLAFGLYKGGAP